MLQAVRRLVGAVSVGACLLAGPALAAGPLKWAPPALVNPVVVTVGTGDFHARIPTNQDCLIRWPSTKHVGYVWIEGCHNLVSIGGWNTLVQTADHSNSAPSRAFYLSGTTGVAHIEGFLVDASGGGMSDGIDINAPVATVQIENVRIDGIFGYADQFHADCVQPFGGVKALRIYNFTCRTGYQGLSIGPTAATPATWTADIERTNIVSIGPQIYGAHNTGGYIYWPCDDTPCTKGALTALNQVYLQPRSVWPFALTVFASSKAASNAIGATPAMSFPGLPIIGQVTMGAPPTGDFVPAGVAGPHYVSPGYAQ